MIVGWKETIVVCKEMIVSCSTMLARNLPEGADENHESPL
jgi:hypothetical protein